jgi:outer membrane immunogenic protein
MKKLVAAATLLPATLASHQALAVDVTAVPADSWTGFHLGAGVGYTWSKAEVDGNYDYYGNCPDFACSDDFGSDDDIGSVIGLIDAGADYQFLDNLVVGIGADFSVGSASESWDALDGVAVDTEIGNSWSIYSRLGFALNDRFLAYGLVGWTSAEVEQTLSIDSFGWQETVSNSDWLNGLTLGGGLEAMVADNVSLKLEYRYTKLDGSTADVVRRWEPTQGLLFDESASVSSDIAMQSVRAVLSYRF